MMIHKLLKSALPVIVAWFILASPAALAQTVALDADGPGETYELLSRTFGGTPYEVPDCGHADFGRHITETYDDELQAGEFSKTIKLLLLK